MPAVLLDQPPDSGLWLPPDALGPDVKIVYTKGRNNGAGPPYYGRRVRDVITTECSHTMGGAGTETPQSFANAEMGSSATLAEIATFPAAASPWGKPTLLQSLPLDAMGVGSVALTPWGLTHESAEMAGDPNAQPWTPDHMALKVAFTAWLIRNPRLAAGDRQWGKVQIRYQVCSSPYPSSAALGGLGFHTMWGDCGVEAGGTNPWSLYCKSCPGYVRRGYGPGKFPGVDHLPKSAGNFRDYYERVGAVLSGPPPTQEDEDMTPEQDALLKSIAAKVAALEPKVNALYGNFDPTASTPPQNIGYWLLWSLLHGDDTQRPATKADLAAAAQALRDALANLPPVPVEVPELTMTLSGTAKAAEPS